MIARLQPSSWREAKWSRMDMQVSKYGNGDMDRKKNINRMCITTVASLYLLLFCILAVLFASIPSPSVPLFFPASIFYNSALTQSISLFFFPYLSCVNLLPFLTLNMNMNKMNDDEMNSEVVALCISLFCIYFFG